MSKFKGDDEFFGVTYNTLSKALEEDAVNAPSHYKDGGIETIDFIDAKKLSYCLGNAVKYISRAGKKNPAKHTEDLKKAIWYIEREISKLG